MDAVELLLVVLGLTAAVAGAGVLTAVWAGRRAGRALTRAVRRRTGLTAGPVRPLLTGRAVVAAGPGRAALRGHALVLRAVAAVPGPGRRAAELRAGLATDVRATVRLVGDADRAGRPVAALRPLVREVRAHARALDLDLAAAGAEPDAAVRRALLADLAGRATRLRSGCAELRAGVRAAGDATTAPLDGLLGEVAEEVGRLRLRAAAYSELA